MPGSFVALWGAESPEARKADKPLLVLVTRTGRLDITGTVGACDGAGCGACQNLKQSMNLGSEVKKLQGGRDLMCLYPDFADFRLGLLTRFKLCRCQHRTRRVRWTHFAPPRCSDVCQCTFFESFEIGFCSTQGILWNCTNDRSSLF